MFHFSFNTKQLKVLSKLCPHDKSINGKLYMSMEIFITNLYKEKQKKEEKLHYR